MDSEGKLSAIRKSIEQKDYKTIKKLIIENDYDDENNFWELLSTLGACLIKDNFDNHGEFFEVCESCMVYIVDKGNPKELLLALLEQADTFDETIRFQTFLQLIQRTILRLPSKQLHSLELALETLAECVRNLELPKSADLEELEPRAHEMDPKVDRINQTVFAFLDFMAPFVEQVSAEKRDKFEGESVEKQVETLMKYLFQILNYSLIYLSLTFDSKAERPVKTNTRLCAEKLMCMITKICPSIHSSIETYKERNEGFNKRVKEGGDISDEDLFGEGLVSELSLACLVYLVHAEELGLMRYPSLFSHQGVLELNLPWIVLLTKQSEIEVRRKGVLLLDSLINNLDPFQLTYNDLDRPEYFKVLDAIFDIMVHCSDRAARQLCVKILPNFIQMFDLDARYQIFGKIFATLTHSGAYGYCVQLLKNQIEEILTGSVSVDGNFVNIKLKKLLFLITSLKDGPATDLLENSDRIISVLNLLRYLILRDPPGINSTGIWSFYPELETKFIKPLFTGLDMSQAHYAEELKGLENKNSKAKDKEVEMSVTVAGFKMPKMERGRRIEVLRQALNTFDVIRSLVVRVEELADQQRKAAT